MTRAEQDSIKESISRIERFEHGYPKRIETNATWQPFFDWQYALCLRRAEELEELSTGQGFLV